MTESTEVEVYLTVAPMHPAEPLEEDAGHPADLFACPDTGHFFTVQNMKVQTTPRSMNPSKSFMCPRCLDTPLTIAPPEKRAPGLPLAKCSSCAWDSLDTDLKTLADLIHQCNPPYPWLTAHFRALKSLHEGVSISSGSGSSDGGLGGTHVPKRGSVEWRTPRNRTASLQNVHAATKDWQRTGNRTTSLQEIQSTSGEATTTSSTATTTTTTTPEGDDDENKDDGDGTFTTAQARHEAEVFRSFVPAADLPPVKQQPRHDMHILTGAIKASMLMPPSQRRANGLSLREQMGPTQRLRRPHVAVRSVFSNASVTSKWDNLDVEVDNPDWCGGYILPNTKVSWRRAVTGDTAVTADTCCLSTEAVDVRVAISNERELGASVRLRNVGVPRQAKEVWVNAGESKDVIMKGFQWSAKGVEHMGWLHCYCDRLIHLQMEVRYDGDDMRVRHHHRSSTRDKQTKQERLARHVWRACFFGRHKKTDCQL